MTIFVTIIHIVVCFVLIAVILLQAGRGQGLTGASFGGGNVQSLFGTKGNTFMTRATTASAIFFMLTCLSLDYIETQKSRSLLETSRAAAPIDVDQIKKALEKVKSEAASGEAAQAVEQVKQAADQAAEGAPVEEAAAAAEAAGAAAAEAQAPAAAN